MTTLHVTVDHGPIGATILISARQGDYILVLYQASHPGCTESMGTVPLDLDWLVASQDEPANPVAMPKPASTQAETPEDLIDKHMRRYLGRVADIVAEATGDEIKPARTAQEIVDQTESLARAIAYVDGYMVMSEASTVIRAADSENRTSIRDMGARGMRYWSIACLAQRELTATDPDDALSELEPKP